MFKVAIFSLNQWALDFDGNTKRILSSIERAKDEGASYRAGPELELCGYSLEDAYFEEDTIYHCWRSLLKIIKDSEAWEIIIDIGMPVQNLSLFNCRVLIYKGKILCIRAKVDLAIEGNYRESRYFSRWPRNKGIEPFRLPDFVSNQLGQDTVPFGDNFILQVKMSRIESPIRIGWEICQELWEINKVSSSLYQDFGCHLVLNGSASYWELRKLSTVLSFIEGISLSGAACYAFSNLVGCDGNRVVFYGRSCIYDRGELVAMTPTDHRILDEVQMITHTIDNRAIDRYRAQMAIRPGISEKRRKVWNLLNPLMDVKVIDATYNVLHLDFGNNECPRKVTNNKIPITREIGFQKEIHLFVSLWLWDYLRRSRMKGFMIPLSGGLDSSSVATLVYAMCQYLFINRSRNEIIQSYFSEIHKIDIQSIESPEKICDIILKCCYLSTKYSGADTESRARDLSACIGAKFSVVSLQDIYQNFRHVMKNNLPDIEMVDDNVTLLDQNLQARLRMAATYYMSEGNRLVLATGNVDEAIVGYLTKYDCSSADLNPIGGLCKNDLKSYLQFCCDHIYNHNPKLVETLTSIINAPPSAELTGSEQRDEDEIGITYDEISVLGRVRKGIYGPNGPVGTFVTIWNDRLNEPFSRVMRCLKANHADKQKAIELGKIVKQFYNRYSRNRHKLTVLTPALHAETYSPDDNRFDHRQFLYAPWTDQYKCIDEMVELISNGKQIVF